MRNRFPSIGMTLGALALGFSISGVFYLMEMYAHRYGHSFEEFGWAIINRLGWWWWSIPIITSMFGLYYAAQLDRPKSKFGFGVRLFALTGFVLYMGSWQNTALGPFAAIFVVMAFVGLIRQLAIACAARRERPSYRDEPFLTRLYASLTTELDDYKRYSR